MGKSIQKKIKFSKGQVSEKLVERTDLELFNSSAQVMRNFTSNIYGGVESRNGTEYIETVNFRDAEDVPTPTVTQSLGGDPALLIGDGGEWISDYIYNERDLFEIDCGDIISGSIQIYNMRLRSEATVFKESDNTSGTFVVPSSRELKVTVSGANGNYSSGADIEFYYVADEGERINYTVRSSGVPVQPYAGDTSVSSSNLNVVAGGGNNATGGVIKSKSIKNLVEIKSESNGSSNLSYTYTGYGFVEIELGYVNVKIMTSADRISWNEVDSRNITTDSNTFTVTPNTGFKYIKAVINEPSEYNIYEKLSVNKVDIIKSATEQGKNVRLDSLIYNNEQKYLLVLKQYEMEIYQDDVKIKTLVVPEILDANIPDIKITYKDDVAIFTHKDMRTKQLSRTETGWEWSDFPYRNIPFYAFDGEVETEKTVGITPSGLEGSVKITADSSVFTSSSVGQLIDGNGGRVRITEYVSGTVVNGVTQIPFYTDDKITSWTLISGYSEVWSYTRGYPATCLFSNQRLWFGGSRSLPATVWASRVGDYNNFKNAGNYDNDAIDVSLLTNNEIVHLIENRGIHILTTGEEYSASEASLTPNGFSVFLNTQNGSLKGVEPILLSGNVLFVERTGKSLLKYVYDYNQASYITDNLSIFSNIINTPIAMDVQINSRDDSGDYIYIVLEDGTMLVACVVLSQNIFSMSSFETKGIVKDVHCVLEDTYITVEREGDIVIEKIGDYTTDMTTKSFIVGDLVDNLQQYDNQEVYIYNDKFAEKHTIYNGQANLKQSIVDNVYVGLSYDYELQSNPIAINNQTNTIKKRIAKSLVLCEDTPKLTFNGQTKNSGDRYSFYACGKYDYDVRFNITGEFYPINILSVTLTINYED